MAVRYLNAQALRQVLPIEDAILAIRDAFCDDREVPRRVALGVSKFMIGRVKNYSGVKVVSVVPGKPVGIVVVFYSAGAPVGLVDGPTLTALRTGAAAGLLEIHVAQLQRDSSTNSSRCNTY